MPQKPSTDVVLKSEAGDSKESSSVVDERSQQAIS